MHEVPGRGISVSLLEKKFPDAYAAAAHLIESGVPLFLARKAASYPSGGSGDTGYIFPDDWQKSEADDSVLRLWTPEFALCAVMGHVVDGLDVDIQKGGSVPEHLRPRSYGRAQTPSGGTHDLIATLGVRSRDGVMTGVDVKAGVAGLGHGFLFLAPTEKLSKSTGELARYSWVEAPDLSPLLLEDDSSGRALAEIINTSRHPDIIRASYEGPSYEELTAEQREMADQHVESTLFDWKVKLGDAAGWDEGVTDNKGRGWEALSRDAAWTVALLAVNPWTGLTESDSEGVYEDLLPAVMEADDKCRGKWYEGLLEKASAQPISQPPWWSSVFFEQTEVLQHIRDAAWSRLASPSGVLALVLARVLVEVPPQVVLPPVVGSVASLNLGIAIQSGSGGGKSSSVNLSAELLGLYGSMQEQIEKGMGSGEGLIDCFLQAEMVENAKGDGMKASGNSILAADPRALIVCDEVEQMEAVGSGRSGSTLNSLLRAALTGDALRTTNSRAGGRNRAVPKRSYRAVVILGVQPGRADILLNEREVATGTPQRFLWCDAADPTRPKENRPSWPGPIDWEPPDEWPEEVWYPEHIQDEVIRHREQFLDGLAGPTEGHLILTRLKVSFALAVLHGETKISDQWWALAGVLLDRSREIQKECYEVLARSAESREVSKETRRAKAIAVATEAVSESRLEKAADALVRKLQARPGEEMTWTQAKPAFRLRDGLDTEEIILEAQKASGVKVEKTTGPQGQEGWSLTYEEN